ncbi:MAG: DNA-directed RNA polymerase subunit B, partial [Methanosphaera sp. rholeuAM74]
MATVKIYINGKLVGTTEEPEEFVEEVKAKRRSNELTNELNITYYEENNEIFIFTDPGRARRPLVIVENGESKLTSEIIEGVVSGDVKWFDLINQGIIEYIDAEEEENAYIAMFEEELTPEHTHLEIDPSTMLGICAG